MKTVRASVLAIFLFAALSARAVILFRTDDPTANTTAPSNDPAASGWNYEGQWGSFLGTPIAPHFFLSAKHIGQAGSDFVYLGMHYTIVANFPDPFSDLDMWEVAETFSSFAPLYTKSDERGLHLIVIGRGTQRGAEITLNSQLRGWAWGTGDGVQRWGENMVSDVINFSSGPDDALYATFDQNGLPNEAHFSAGDSGGAVFVQDSGVWKLAGINYAVDGPLYTDSLGDGMFVAALFNMRDYYYSDGGNPPQYIQITDPPPVPSGFYATRISSKLAWIYSVIDPTGVANTDGISNLLEYAQQLNAAPPNGYGDTVVAMDNGFLIITYRKIGDASNLQYQVEQSTDLVTWQNATTQDQVLSTSGNIQTITSKVAIGNNNPLFLRLRVTETSTTNPTLRRVVYRIGSVR